MTDFMKSRNMEEDMAEDRHLWRLGVDGRLFAVQILYIYNLNTGNLKIVVSTIHRNVTVQLLTTLRYYNVYEILPRT